MRPQTCVSGGAEGSETVADNVDLFFPVRFHGVHGGHVHVVDELSKIPRRTARGFAESRSVAVNGVDGKS